MDGVVVDTNVLVSALIGKGNPRKVLEIILSGRVSFCLSTPVLSEYVTVLRRPKFAQYSEFAANASLTLKSLQGIALFSEPKILIRACPDPDDNKFLTLAVSAGARYMVTGNKRHFPFRSFRGTRVVSPTEFVKLFI